MGEEIHKLKNGARQFEKNLSRSKKEISSLLAEKKTLEWRINYIQAQFATANCDTHDELTEEKARIITLERKLTEKEKEIIQLKEEMDVGKHGTRQSEKALSSVQ